jgi:hypothetical protein
MAAPGQRLLPREEVIDAEALITLLSSAKSSLHNPGS